MKMFAKVLNNNQFSIIVLLKKANKKQTQSIGIQLKNQKYADEETQRNASAGYRSFAENYFVRRK